MNNSINNTDETDSYQYHASKEEKRFDLDVDNNKRRLLRRKYLSILVAAVSIIILFSLAIKTHEYNKSNEPDRTLDSNTKAQDSYSSASVIDTTTATLVNNVIEQTNKKENDTSAESTNIETIVTNPNVVVELEIMTVFHEYEGKPKISKYHVSEKNYEGQILRESDFNSDGEPEIVWEYEYNEDGRKFRENGFSKTKDTDTLELLQVIETEYKDDGTYIQTTTYMVTGEASVYEDTYDPSYKPQPEIEDRSEPYERLSTVYMDEHRLCDSWERDVLKVFFYYDGSYNGHLEYAYEDVNYKFESYSALGDLNFNFSNLDYLVDYCIDELEFSQTYDYLTHMYIYN